MIERDGREDADVGRDGSGGIKSPAHACFKNDEIAFAIAEMPHCEREGEFEEGGVMFPIGDKFAELGEKPGCFFFGDFEAADANAFAVVDEVG